MWGGTDEKAAVEAIHRAYDLGVTSIDTAAIYGYGLSEELVGRAIRDLPRDRLQVLTKFGLRWDLAEGEHFFTWTDPDGSSREIYRNARVDSIMYECEQSLRRLGTDYIDLYQCHWRDHTTPVEESMLALERLVEQGKVRAAGVSNFTPAEIEAGSTVVPIASCQPPYSMVNRSIEAELLPYCRNRDVGVIVYSPLHKGLLTGKLDPGHQFPPGDHRSGDPCFRSSNILQVNEMLARLRPIAEAHQATLAQVVIAWTIRQPGITAALVGARTPEQAEQNARAAELQLSDDELARITGLTESLHLELD
jgi:aryl-alcohol dehydrogenase-like predicted oxidoreductase